MASSGRLNQNYRANASKLHISIGELLKSSPLFSNYRIYQEYPVNRISPYYDSGAEKFDWIILDLQIIIECHGKQHAQPVCFGGISKEEAEENFKQQVIRDMLKKKAAIEAGWTYIVFWYYEEITIESLFEKIQNAQNCIKAPQEPPKKRGWFKRQEIAKEYRKKRYQAWKERLNEYRRRKRKTSSE